MERPDRSEIRTTMFEGLRIHDSNESDDAIECCLTSEAVAVMSTIPVVTWDDLRQATMSSEETLSLMETIQERFPAQILNSLK